MEKLKEKTYKIEIIETTSRIIEVKAKSNDEAWNKISEMYKKGEIVLDYRDYIDTEIIILDTAIKKKI
jgi:hypothetical protein